MSPAKAPIAVALDAPDLDTVIALARAVSPHVSTLKVGLEFYLGNGPQGVEQVMAATSDSALFLDLKLHDIPNTVAGAAQTVALLHPRLLTVHALGGDAVVRAAAEALPRCLVTAVTVLTSMSASDLEAVGLSGSPRDAVLTLAKLSVKAGARALVCSPREVAVVRETVGPDILLVTPGVRPAGSDTDDQRRVATPEQAMADGADLLVIGRPITAAADPAAAAARIGGTLSARPLPGTVTSR
jgi:orotidine-5'-phosphate decarboxylase